MSSPDHLAPGDRRALDEYVGRLRRELGDEIVELRLFGSKARGTATPESDIDVLVVVESATPDVENRIVDLAFDVNLDHGVLISPVVFSRNAREGELWPFTTLGREAERDGFPL